MDPDRRLGGSDRGVSNVLGFVLVFALVIGGSVTILAVGSDAITETQSQSEMARAEQSLTVLDSRAAMVGLGSADAQSVSFGRQSGRFETDPDAGWIEIRHENHHGTTNNEQLYRESLGAVVYRNGETTIAYQGGGVWRQDGSGEARLVSTPEFQFRDGTVTLPVMRVAGRGSISGSATATITPETLGVPVFPDESETYADTGDPYRNPIDTGSVHVTVHSEYYQGWAQYFRTHTTGTVTVRDAQQEVEVTLETVAGAPGTIDPVTEPISVTGFAGNHAVDDFSFTLADGTSSISNSYWSLWVQDDGDRWEFNIQTAPGSGCTTGVWSGDVSITQFYQNGTTGTSEEWKGTIPETDAQSGSLTTSAVEIKCSGNNVDELQVDLTNPNTQIEYGDFSTTSDSHWKFADEIEDADAPSSVQFDQHTDISGEPETYTDGDTETVNHTVNHYLSRIDTEFDIEIHSGSGGSDPVDESSSIGELQYALVEDANQNGFLHVTDNRIEIALD